MEMKKFDRVEKNWILPGAVQDRQSITSEWQWAHQKMIEGVQFKEIKNVPKENGFLTEIFRKDWDLGSLEVGQVFQVTLFPGAVSAWHTHQSTVDRLYVAQGLMKIVLYDSRKDSSTFGGINEFRIGSPRPALIVIPPQVWHGIQNLSQELGILLNLVDKAYCYENPDHWRLPPDSAEIPYTFQSRKSLDPTSL